jgi:stringent starvation protein B
MSQPLPPKKEVALALLERSRVHVHLDPRKDGVIVPAGFRKQAQLVLEIGLNMPVPIPDLRLDDDGMTCTLSFNRTPFYCIVPWPSVFAMVGDDGRGMVWPDDVPPEIAAAAQGGVRPAEQPAPKPRVATKRAQSALAEIPSDDKPKGKKPSRAKKPRVVAVEAEPERPVLVALPPPAERKGPRAVPSEKKRAPPPPRPSAGKAKRELPPYLRVVK